MDYIEKPITDIINKYITTIIGNSISNKMTRVVVSRGYIFIMLRKWIPILHLVLLKMIMK